MPEAMREGTRYVLTNELGHKIQFTYRGRDPDSGRLHLEVDGEEREYDALEDLADGHFSSLVEADA